MPLVAIYIIILVVRVTASSCFSTLRKKNKNLYEDEEIMGISFIDIEKLWSLHYRSVPLTTAIKFVGTWIKFQAMKALTALAPCPRPWYVIRYGSPVHQFTIQNAHGRNKINLMLIQITTVSTPLRSHSGSKLSHTGIWTR